MPETYQDVKVDRDGEVGVITLDRPKVNALGPRLFEELGRALEELYADAQVRVIVLTGAGQKAFSAGADLSSSFSGGIEGIDEALAKFHGLLDRMETGPKVIIGAINANAFGGGLELAMGCHLLLADPGARMGLTETNVGLFPAGGGTQRLPRLVGLGRAQEMIIFGQRIDAEEALRIGLVQRVASAPGKALEEAIAWGREVAKRPPIAVHGALQSIYCGLRMGPGAGLECERQQFARTATSQDAMEGMAAFFERREPQFKGH